MIRVQVQSRIYTYNHLYSKFVRKKYGDKKQFDVLIWRNRIIIRVYINLSIFRALQGRTLGESFAIFNYHSRNPRLAMKMHNKNYAQSRPAKSDFKRRMAKLNFALTGRRRISTKQHVATTNECVVFCHFGNFLRVASFRLFISLLNYSIAQHSVDAHNKCRPFLRRLVEQCR